MNSVHMEYSSDRDYPAIELDMADFMEHLSEEYMCGEVDVSNGSMQTNLKIIDYKTEECTDLGDMLSIATSGLAREQQVR